MPLPPLVPARRSPTCDLTRLLIPPPAPPGSTRPSTLAWRTTVAACSTCYAPCAMHHLPCTTCHAAHALCATCPAPPALHRLPCCPCTMHYLPCCPCTMHHACISGTRYTAPTRWQTSSDMWVIHTSSTHHTSFLPPAPPPHFPCALHHGTAKVFFPRAACRFPMRCRLLTGRQGCGGGQGTQH